MVNEERLLEVEIEVGMVDGQTTTFVAEGEPHMVSAIEIVFSHQSH